MVWYYCNELLNLKPMYHCGRKNDSERKSFAGSVYTPEDRLLVLFMRFENIEYKYI